MSQGGTGRQRRVSRAKLQERRLQAAAAVDVAPSYDVIVVGGGASGLVAAICAGEKGAHVLLLESSPECGRPLLATGNGRCNFSNVGLAPKYYNDPAFVQAVFGDDPLADILSFFRQCNMRWCLEEERLYPLSRRAASVRNVLLRRAWSAGVTIACARSVIGASRTDEGFKVTYREEFADNMERVVESHSLVVSTGGTQSTHDFDVADSLGLESKPAQPILCPVGCEPNPILDLDGRRLHVRAQLTHTAFPVWSERGEVLLRSYGLSGIVVFNMSRQVIPGDLIELDLLPDLTKSELQQMVDPFAHGSFEDGCLDGVLDPDVASTLEGLARSRWTLEDTGRNEPASDSEALMALAKSYPLRATGTTGHEQAQVLRGGLCTNQFSTETLECTSMPGLFATGEALDVDGECGGFNLSWAWKSGMVAGTAAATR